MRRWSGMVLGMVLATGGVARADVNADVIAWCIDSMAEFGEGAVHGCIRTEQAAAAAVEARSATAPVAVERCTLRRLPRGWSAVQQCVEEAIATGQLPPEPGRPRPRPEDLPDNDSHPDLHPGARGL